MEIKITDKYVTATVLTYCTKCGTHIKNAHVVEIVDDSGYTTEDYICYDCARDLDNTHND